MANIKELDLLPSHTQTWAAQVEFPTSESVTIAIKEDAALLIKKVIASSGTGFSLAALLDIEIIALSEGGSAYHIEGLTGGDDPIIVDLDGKPIGVKFDLVNEQIGNGDFNYFVKVSLPNTKTR